MRLAAATLVLAACNRPYDSGLAPKAKLATLGAAEVCDLVISGQEHAQRQLSDDDLCYISANLLASGEAAARGTDFDRRTCEVAFTACSTLGVNDDALFLDASEVDCDKAGKAAWSVSDDCDARVSEYEACVDAQAELLARWAELGCRKPIYTDADDFDGAVPRGCDAVMSGACLPGSK